MAKRLWNFRIHIDLMITDIQADNSRATEGNGIGMSVMKKIVELHKGIIEIESELGEGTLVTVTLPK